MSLELHRRSFRFWRTRPGKLLLAAALLMLGLCALEAGLRIAGFGHATGFAVARDVGGNSLMLFNPAFPLRFYPKNWPVEAEPFALEAVKPDRTFRIVILGGAMACGAPDPAFGFARLLRLMLEAEFSGVHIEVLNAAMPGASSTVACAIARDCAVLEPDLFVVLLGESEVNGPFGPANEIFPAGLPPWQVRARLAFGALRFGQALAAAHDWQWPEPVHPWGDNSFLIAHPLSADAPGLQAMYTLLQANVEAICRVAQRAGAKTVLCSMPSNLRDCAPFHSMHRANLDAAGLQAWQAAFDKGVEFEAAGKAEEALEQFGLAAALDDRFAELGYRMGHCQAQLGADAEARASLIAARDLDGIRLRTDSRINELLRETASRRGAVLVDLDEEFAIQSPGRLPGDNLFSNHAELSFHGHYAAARSVCLAIRPMIMERFQLGRFVRVNPLTEKECVERLGFTPVHERRALERVIAAGAKPPYDDRGGLAERDAGLRRRLEELAPQLEPGRTKTYVVWLRDMLEKNAEDGALRAQFAVLLDALNDRKGAAEQWRLLAERTPYDGGTWLALGRARKALDDHAGALEAFRQAAAWKPFHPEACRELAAALDKTGNLNEAVLQYRRLLELDPCNADAYGALSDALAGSGKPQEALDVLQAGLRMSPNKDSLHLRLGRLLERKGLLDDAMKEYSRAAADAPENMDVQAVLAAALLRKGDSAGAAAILRRLAAMRPQDIDVRMQLGNALQTQGASVEAVGTYEEVLALEPWHAEAYAGIACLLFQEGDYAGAWNVIQRCRVQGCVPPSDVLLDLSKADALPAS